MSFTLKIDTRPLKDLQKKCAKNRVTEVNVGFFPEDRYGPDNGNLPVAQVAKFMEDGSADYPDRPFFTDTMEDHRTKNLVKMNMITAVRTFLTPRGNFRKVVFETGELLAELIQSNIESYPGQNSARWAEVKGFNDPLIYTRKMVNSVKVKFVK